MAEGLKRFIRPIREKREEILIDDSLLKEIFEKGLERAREIAQQTMKKVREAIGI
jgi:tryptophanyl-tRNA synthetase